MFGPRKNILWANHASLPVNPYPLFKTKNFSVGGETNNFAVFVPMLFGQKSVKEVEKAEGDKSKGGKDLSLKHATDFRGSGTTAFLHPVKVAKICIKIKFTFFFAGLPI